MTLATTSPFGLVGVRLNDGFKRDLRSVLRIILGSLSSRRQVTCTMLLSIVRYVVILLYFCSLTKAFARSIGRSESSYKVKEKHHVPRGWSRVGSAPPWHKIQLQIGLIQSHFAELERHLYEGEGSLLLISFQSRAMRPHLC